MSVTTRHFLVEGDEIRPFPQSLYDRLRRGEAVLPRYAGRDLHVVDVAVEIERRAPVRIRKIGTAILSLDEQGGLRSRLLEELRASLKQSRSGSAPVPAGWSPSKAQLDRVTALALARTTPKLKPPRAGAAAAAERSTGSGGRRGRVARQKRGE